MGNKKLNTNSNSYILLYAVALVIVSAFLLAFVSQSLKEKSDANVAIDKKSQILASLNIRDVEHDSIESLYDKAVLNDRIIDAQGNVVDNGDKKDSSAFVLSSKDISDSKLPLYICSVDGKTKYVIPLYGKGLWGGIWGYIALDEDKQTVFGAYFNHESETAGLGALITEAKFQEEFNGKRLQDDKGNFISVVKKGTVKDPTIQCDGISGATKTSVGVSNMLTDCLSRYKTFISANK